MIVEPLSTENLKEGIFCPAGDPDADGMYEQLGAWLSGEMLRGQVARSESNEIYGFILYYPVESAPIEILGEGFYVVQCMNVKEEAAGMGVGKALLEAGMRDARGHGAKGVAVTSYSSGDDTDVGCIPGSFYRKMGFSEVGQRGNATLLFAKFEQNTPNPVFAPMNYTPDSSSGRVRVDVLDCSRCWVGVKTSKLIDKIAESLREKVEVRHHDQSSRAAVIDKGMSSGVFIDGELTFFGDPVSEDDIMRALEVALIAYYTRTDRAAEG